MKMAIRLAIVSRGRKDFGGTRILATREEAWEGAQGGERGRGNGQGISGGVICLFLVCLLWEELVQAAFADYNLTFGGGQGHGEER